MSENAGSQSNSAEGDGREAFMCVYVQSFVGREWFTSTKFFVILFTKFLILRH